MRLVVFTAGLALLATGLCSCMAFKTTMQSGLPLDLSRVSQIKPEVTELRDVLTWFGPPEQIIDGTQEILDQQAMMVSLGAPMSTRTLSAPDGAVILLYRNQQRTTSSTVMATTPVGTHGKSKYSVRSNEMMIFVRKADYKVLDVLVGGTNDAGS